MQKPQDSALQINGGQKLKDCGKFKVVVIGDQNVGKTSIISQYANKHFDLASNPTIGIDFLSKHMILRNQSLRLQLWDTAGQERFRSLIPSYVRDADACLVVLDVTVHSTFDNLNKWCDFIREESGEDALIVLVANKADCQNRQVTSAQIEELAKNNNYLSMEVSAKTGHNIIPLFEKVAKEMIAIRLESGSKFQEISPQKYSTISLNQTSPTLNQGYCRC